MAEKAAETLAQVRGKIRKDRDLIAKAEARIVENLRRAIELGASAPEVAEDAGYTVSRVGQLVGGVRRVRKAAGTPNPKRPKAAKPERQAVADDPDPEPAAEAEDERRPSFTPGAVDRVRQLGHAAGLVSDRWAKPREERRTLFVNVATGKWHASHGNNPAHHFEGQLPWRAGSAAELLEGVPAGTERVFFVGPYRPGVTPDRVREHGSAAAAARAWFLDPVPEGWSGSHHLSDDASLTGRWKHTDGRALEVQHAAVWFGHGDYSARDAAMAWAALRHMLDAACSGTVLMSTPATTGRDMWRRMIPERSKGFPVLSEELRQLIHHTSGQGRRELVSHEPVSVGMVTQYDMRIAYAALTWGMPVGLPTMVNKRAWDALDDDGQAAALGRRGRWLVRATVPTGWDHIGILPHLSAEGWVWPSTPGQTFRSWCSASELAVAREHGWRCDVIEGFHFAEGKPLNNWRDALMSIYTRAESAPAEAGRSPQLVKAAVRMMLLGTIGAFASRVRAVTHTAAEGEPLPTDVQVREVAGRYVWETAGERSEWTERTSHPEWAAEIWGRCRTRLLEHPMVDGVRTGALHVPPGSVIGLRTDGLTLVGDPEWPDNGKPGVFRLTGRARGSFEWPQSDGALSELKRTIEGAYETGEMQ
ncbi:hypothetical protein [Streptomyces collinus]|uniref:Uncharacterized protein n=1 Tax=Streptomyces collinus (strain DSM 40733 / Tue 365) TaxID=1214242 RepID=S5VFD0_STRC3|nr:hypothetical protein [Streptomyces collinus]AGS73929.1 hypothetical protein B446_35853 [Streptomyces collinus Tu 365]UJA06131.1 hypothetical protein HGI10_00100 [Streptomyces collinus]UJA12699.1 hypothetical protein HGI10_66840 [Streptomyces collinus]